MSGLDVLVFGEPLVELTAPTGLRDARELRLSVSGDALNAAAASAAAGAATALVTAVGDDVLGDRVVQAAHALGVDTRHVLRRPRPTGIYFSSPDRGDGREAVYVRDRSAATAVGAADLDGVALDGVGALVVGGIAQAISASSAAAVEALVARAHAAGVAVVYDPNFRPALTTPDAARRALASVAARTSLVTPSVPEDAEALLGTGDAAEAADRCRALGAPAVAVTRGADGVLLAVGDDRTALAAPRVPEHVDATGAGDVLTGTTAARLALGDPLVDALQLGLAAATLSLRGLGGTGALASLEESRALAAERPRAA